MSRQIEGLWLGGAISVEAAEIVEKAIRKAEDMESSMLMHDRKVTAELRDLANAIRAQIQKVPQTDWRDLL